MTRSIYKGTVVQDYLNNQGIIMIQRSFYIILTSLIATVLMLCESVEDDLIFQAESCINEKAGTGNIGECSSFLETLSSPRANTLKCSVKLEASGLDNSNIIDAIEVIENSSGENNEVHFMALVSLNSIDEADETSQVCKNTDRPGLEYIASAARMGTYFANAAGIVGEIGTDRAPTTDELNDMLANCSGTCTEAVGETASTIHEVYCVGTEASDEDICMDVSEAISSGNTNLEIGQKLICLFDDSCAP